MTLIFRRDGNQLNCVCEVPNAWFRGWLKGEYFSVDVTPPLTFTPRPTSDTPIQYENFVATFKLTNVQPGPRTIVECVGGLEHMLAHPEVKPWAT